MLIPTVSDRYIVIVKGMVGGVELDAKMSEEEYWRDHHLPGDRIIQIVRGEERVSKTI
jgi:hypothetical protein